MTLNASAEVPPARRREWMGLGIIALPCLIYSMDLNVLHLAIPSLTADLAPSASQLLWIIDIYGFLVAGLLITMGTLGDRIGRRRLLMIGAAAFGIASILAASSNSAELLILSRALLGIAGATLAPSTLSLIRNMFLQPRQRTVAIGVWAGCFAAGNTLGPIVGGFLIENFWWGAVFLPAVPVMALLLILAPALLPEFRSPTRGPLDLANVALATLTMLTSMHGLKRIAEHGSDAWAIASVLCAIALGVLFVRRQKSLAEPVIDWTLFRNRSFSVALCANVVSVFAASGSFLFATQYLQIVSGMSPWRAGLWFAPLGIVHLAGAMLTPALMRLYEPRTLLVAGFLVTAFGYALLTQVNAHDSVWLLIGGVALFFAGLAPMLTMTTDMVMSAVLPAKAGAASGISETSAEFGAALGIAMLGSLGTAVYRFGMSGGGVDGVPVDVLAAASHTAGAAIATAQQLQGTIGAALLEVAREAFTLSMQVVAIASCALSIIGAVFCARLLRPVQTDLVCARPIGGHSPGNLNQLTRGTYLEHASSRNLSDERDSS